MIPKKYQNESDTIKQLFTLGNPHKREAVRLNQWDDHLAQGFTESDVPALIKIILDIEPLFTMTEGWACLYAWRTLGQLKSTEAIGPLISIIDLVHDNDWVLGELPTVMGMIGEPAIEPLFSHLIDNSPVEYSRVTASDGLAEIAKPFPSLITVGRKRKKHRPMQSPEQNLDELNGLVVSSLMDLKAVELIDLIRPLYEQGIADITISGDLEDVEIGFGLRSKRDTPKPHYDDPRLAGLTNPFENGSATQTFVHDTPKPGRDDPCPCGSGKKYKKCCLNK